MHKAADSTARHVWFSPSHNLLKWALARNVPGAKNPQSADNKERSTSVNHMASVVSGARLFPSQENKGACTQHLVEGKPVVILGAVYNFCIRSRPMKPIATTLLQAGWG